MDGNVNGLDRLCQLYENLEDKEKELVIKLAEGLLNCQKVFDNGKDKTENVVLDSDWTNFCIEVYFLDWREGMNMSGVELLFHILAAVGSILSGIIMLITFIQVVTRLKLKNEVVYGNEATLQYNNIKDTKLKGSYKLEPYEYEGGNNKIIPRLEIEKFIYNPIIMEDKLKQYKKRVRYFYIGDNNKRYVKTWYLIWSLNDSRYFFNIKNPI